MKDPLITIEIAVIRYEIRNDEQAKAVLLDLAEMIPTLKIVLDGEVLRGG